MALLWLGRGTNENIDAAVCGVRFGVIFLFLRHFWDMWPRRASRMGERLARVEEWVGWVAWVVWVAWVAWVGGAMAVGGGGGICKFRFSAIASLFASSVTD